MKEGRGCGEERGQIEPSPQKNLPSKSLALLGLNQSHCLRQGHYCLCVKPCLQIFRDTRNLLFKVRFRKI